MKPGKLLPLIAAFGAGFLTAFLVIKPGAGKEVAPGEQALAKASRAAPVEFPDSKSLLRQESPKAMALALTDAQRETKAYVAHLKSCDLSELLDEFERAIQGGGKVSSKPEAAEQWLAQQPESPQRDALNAAAMVSFVNAKRYAEAAQSVNSIQDPGIQQQAIERLDYIWTQKDPAGAAAWRATLPDGAVSTPGK